MKQLVAFIAVVFIFATFPETSSDGVNGTWMSRVVDHKGQIQLTMQIGDNWTSSFGISLTEFKGLNVHNMDESTGDVDFSLGREAGTVSFHGTFRDGKGSGFFTFQENDQFTRDLMTLGFAKPDNEEEFSLALHGVGINYIKQLVDLHYTHLTVDDLISMSIHEVTPEYIKGLNNSGYKNLSVDDLVSMKIHDVTLEFIHDIRNYRNAPISADDLVSLRIHGRSE